MYPEFASPEPQFHSGSSQLLSLLLHVAVVAALLGVGPSVFSPPSQAAPQIEVGRNLGKVFVPQGGGGGGDRSPLPAPKGRPPAFASFQLTPPAVVIANPNPKLPETPTLIGPPEIQIAAELKDIGDPWGPLGPPSNGTGTDSGIGTGKRGGVGPGDGPGAGEGKAGGCCGGVFMPGFGGVSRPQLVWSIEPEYSDEARKAKHQGTVTIAAVVDTDGSVRELRVVNSLGMGLDEKALEAVKKWRFKPATRQGRPVAVHASIAVTFRLL